MLEYQVKITSTIPCQTIGLQCKILYADHLPIKFITMFLLQECFGHIKIIMKQKNRLRHFYTI